MGKYLNSKGRAFIGWDEIMEGGLAANASVMSWRGYEAGLRAAKIGSSRGDDSCKLLLFGLLSRQPYH